MSTFNYCDAPNGICVTNQPPAKLVLGSISTFPVHEKRLQNDDDERHYQCEHGQTSPSEHHRCHNIRLRQLIWPALLVLLALGGLLAWSCVNWHGWSTWGVDSLVGRALNDTTSSNDFVHRKLYLIIIFVGLLLVLVLGIMLTFCCCRGSFENPLCCPCYLCACCGGISCLECIGCGLCCAAAEVA